MSDKVFEQHCPKVNAVAGPPSQSPFAASARQGRLSFEPVEYSSVATAAGAGHRRLCDRVLRDAASADRVATVLAHPARFTCVSTGCGLGLLTAGHREYCPLKLAIANHTDAHRPEIADEIRAGRSRQGMLAESHRARHRARLAVQR